MGTRSAGFAALIGRTCNPVVAIHIRRIGAPRIDVAGLDTIAGETVVTDVVVWRMHASARLSITRINRANDAVVAVQGRTVDAEGTIARFCAVAGVAIVALRIHRAGRRRNTSEWRDAALPGVA